MSAEDKKHVEQPVEEEDEEEEEDLDLFGEGGEDDKEWEAEFERRAKEGQAKIEAKEAAKRAAGKDTRERVMGIFEIKPYEPETDLDEIIKFIKETVVFESLKWGECKLEPIGYGIKKIVAACIFMPDLCNQDEIVEAIEEHDDVQSVEIASMNKMS
ncbi:hypothetical protein ADUPG1_007823 [Aduncisulcus paluster]|uniref:Translation elongation factor EF1B beta/delta subunit guanine nucleotide exchange domain-containing protein n=1 Tax=Aduncisulcus paluster TaxID=2918883 RepID=A0ABQ5KPN8_9EUKA|nr:hypothetical protein ADUPG1_007823 [Aduncisulcus paluster]